MRQLRLPVAQSDLLHRHHGIAADGQRRTGHDLYAVVAPRQSERRVAGGLHGLNAKAARAVAYTPAVQRDPIHGHPIEGWLVALGVDVFPQHRPRALRQRQRLDRQTGQVLRDELIRLGGTEHGQLLSDFLSRGLEDLHLRVELVRHRVQLVDRGVVLLDLDGLELLLLLLGERGPGGWPPGCRARA